MSPASQGNLEVERYIGSCLISSTVRVNSSSGAGIAVTNTSHHKSKKVADGSGGGGPRPAKLLNSRAGSCQEQHYHHQHHHGNYNGVLPLCECGGLKYTGGAGGSGGGARYGSAGRSWAGMPLISMASSGARRNRKPSTGSTGSAGTGKNCKGGEGEQSGQQTRTPLSRLAIHTQGAPLILAGRYNNSNRKNNAAGGNIKGPPVRQFRNNEYPVRKYNNNNNNNNFNNAKDARDSVSSSRDARNVGGVVASGVSSVGNNGSTPSIDSLSVASDESSGHSENSLPRIIKPRKRRKKDRKPPPPTVNPPQSTDSTKTTSSPSETKIQESSNIVTLKPYVPLCYELYDNGYRKEGGGRRKAWEAPKVNPQLVLDDERASQTSEEDAHDPKLHHEFEDVEEEEDTDVISLETSSLFPYPCPSASLCQCRYCDPAGLIWDVDQHCYSPFLTPPSPGNDNSFTNSPFANIPLFLNPPSSSESRSFDLFDNKDCSSSVFKPENDNSGLRRSWSDPSTSHSSSSNSFPDFGLATSGWCDNSRLGSISSEVSSTSTMSSLSSQSLEVSTEIVTSPNGHRDIEIKFYSSSPPAVAAPRELQLPGCEKNNTSLFSSTFEGGVWTNSRDDSVNVGYGVNTWGCAQSDGALWGVEHGCASDYDGVWDHEQNAKRLGEEVNQLRLQVEE